MELENLIKKIALLKVLIILNFTNLKALVADIRGSLLGIDKTELIGHRPFLKVSNLTVEEYRVCVYHLKERMKIYIWNDLIMIVFRNWIIFMDGQDELHIFDKKTLAKKWDNAKNRCYRETSSSHKSYHDRGIKLCSEWFERSNGFIVWSVMFGGYYEGSVIDRIDNDLDYEPDNIRYGSISESLNNKRNNLRLTVNGEEKTIAQWSRQTGISYQILRALYHRNKDKLRDLIENALDDQLDDMIEEHPDDDLDD